MTSTGVALLHGEAEVALAVLVEEVLVEVELVEVGKNAFHHIINNKTHLTFLYF